MNSKTYPRLTQAQNLLASGAPVRSNYSCMSTNVDTIQLTVRCHYAGPQCNRPMGMENRKIRSQQISVSSEFNKNHAAHLGRLNQKRAGKAIGAWSAAISNSYQFFQIDMRVPMKVTSVSTQGRDDNTNQWVTRYLVSYSLDGAHFTTYWSQGRAWVRI